MAAKIFVRSRYNCIPRERAVVESRGGSRLGSKVSIKHVGQIHMEFLRGARVVVRVAEDALLEGRLEEAFIQGGLDTTVDVSNQNIFLPSGDVKRDADGEFLPLPGT